MVLWLFLTTAVVGVLLIVGLIYASTHQDTAEASILLIVVIASALGGFVSCLQRLYAFEDCLPAEAVRQSTEDAQLVFNRVLDHPASSRNDAAAVIYVIFAAEVIKGPAFPQFTCENGKAACKTFIDFMNIGLPLGQSSTRKQLFEGSFLAFQRATLLTFSISLAARGGSLIS